jgi:hypothetical protein
MITIHWTYLPLAKPRGMSHKEIELIIADAADEWNKAMHNLVSFQHGTGDLQVRLFFDNTIDKTKFPNRIAECRDKRGNWEIEFDIRTKWNNGKWWKKLLGIGENFVAASIHELGHVMDLPHSSDYSHIMHSEIADCNALSKSESLKYRQFFLEREKFNN